MTLYGKKSVTEPVSAMARKGRIAHAFLLTGDKGVGKKTCARYIAKTIVCDDLKDGVPCGVCRQCRRVDSGMHPDVITPERTGKTLIYNAETIRAMCSDAYTMPNDCASKVYMLPDCENLQERTQNVLLKLIEEPPDYAYFIFTAENKGTFLPTVLSRVVSLAVTECTEDECRLALRENTDLNDDEIENAVGMFRGNIGRCEAKVEGDEAVKVCRSAVECIINSDEYGLCAALNSIGENREKVKDMLSLLDKVIRDVCAVRLYGAQAVFIGCFKEGAIRLAERMSFRKALYIHEVIGKNISRCSSSYINVPLAMAAFCAEFFG